jgi:hypothetical protein
MQSVENSVSEEHVASIFGVKQEAKQETSMKAEDRTLQHK